MIRLAQTEDIPRLLEIYTAAKAFMRQNGNLHQWNNNYPARKDLEQDISARQLYVAQTQTGRLWGCFMLTAGPDPTYTVIYDGQWAQNTPYGVLHRIASDGSQKGLVCACINFASRKFPYLRIDTHADNLPMQRALVKEGFHYRGTIIAGDGTPRLAYDRILTQ